MLTKEEWCDPVIKMSHRIKSVQNGEEIELERFENSGSFWGDIPRRLSSPNTEVPQEAGLVPLPVRTVIRTCCQRDLTDEPLLIARYQQEEAAQEILMRCDYLKEGKSWYNETVLIAKKFQAPIT